MSEIKLYTIAEVADNNGKNGKRVWIVIKDTVYDVTDYLEEHPGGADLLLEHAGKDATSDFNNVGHSSDAKNILKQFKIGELIEDDKKGKKKLEKEATGKMPEEIKPRSCVNIVTCGLFG